MNLSLKENKKAWCTEAWHSPELSVFNAIATPRELILRKVQYRSWQKSRNLAFRLLKMFFPQDPMLLYQQSPYMTPPVIPRSPPVRSSFLIDDLLVRRQSPYIVPKQPQDNHLHEPQVSSGNGNSFKFGMPSIFSRTREERSTIYQGTFLINFTTYLGKACLRECLCIKSDCPFCVQAYKTFVRELFLCFAFKNKSAYRNGTILKSSINNFEAAKRF